MIYSEWQIWAIILGLGLGTYLLRLSFLGLIGSRPMPEWVLRHLRYTAVAVMPGLITPLILFPQATDGQLEPVRLSAALATIAISLWTRNATLTILGGATVLFGLHFALG